jgi:glycosyltransferase involved in cell wall biosynthesis
MSVLRILVDAHMIGRRQTGNETYIVGLLSGLAGLPDLRLAAAVDADASIPDELRVTETEWMPLRSRSNWARLVWDLNDLSRRWRADVVHATYVAPFGCPCPRVVTLHDVSFRRFPEFFSLRDRVFFSTLVPACLRRAAAIITDSDHARTEISTFFPQLTASVTAIPLGVGPRFRKVDDASRLDVLRRRYDAGDGFVLAVGNVQPRKNLATLIRAYGRLRQHFPRVNLVIVGRAAGAMPRLRALVTQLELGPHVHFTGYVTTEELRELYSAARLFVHASVYEGFGLPILEAMACGTPVVAANTSSVPEVAGEAALLAPSAGEHDLLAAMLQVLGDDALAGSLRERGLTRIERFSWAETARRTSAVYHAVSRRQRSR